MIYNLFHRHFMPKANFMTEPPSSRVTQQSTGISQRRSWLDRAWLAVAALALLGLAAWLGRGGACDYLATDFRGYYAAGLIARQSGQAAIYDPRQQVEAQAMLTLECPDGTERASRLQVFVPYLPVFSVIFLPLPELSLTAAYTAWSLLGLAVFVGYLVRFMRAEAPRVDWLRLAQWGLCFPLLANLFLGQSNIWLVIVLGEFYLAARRDKPILSGLWLAGLLLKPHLLVLLIPGLLIARRWRTLLGFGLGATGLLAASLLLAGPDGMQAGLAVVREFAGTAFGSVPEMMNARGLAFNLGRILPEWIAWAMAVSLMLVTTVLVLVRWRNHRWGEQTPWLLLITLAGTCVVAWHANLYLWLMLTPFLLALDARGDLPLAYLVVWAFGPLVVFFPVYAASPALAQPALAMVMLGANLAVVVDAGRRMGK